MGTSVAQEDYLKFLFELSPDFSVIPSFGVIPAFGALNDNLISGLPGFEVDPTKVISFELFITDST